MSYKLSIIRKPKYLHAIVTGSNSKENVKRYLEEIHRECMAQELPYVLIEEHLEGSRLKTTDVHEIASEGADRARGQFMAIAYVDVNAKDHLMWFAEDVAVTRGLPIKVFSSITDAEYWLQVVNR